MNDNARAAIGVWLALALTGPMAAVQACGASGADRDPAPASPAEGDAGPENVPAPPPSDGGVVPPAVPPATDPGPTAVPSPPAAPAAATGLTVFFRLDPRITRSHYMGDRWVAPATFTLVVTGADVILDARAHLVSAGGTLDVSATWTPADPEMLSVSAPAGHEVAIAVRRAGRSTLTVAAPQGSRELVVTAAREGGSWRVDVTQ